MHCSKRGKVQTQMLPPCRSELIQHWKRANYQYRVWCLRLENDPTYEPIDEDRWCFVNEGNNDVISIKWMDCKPAPDEVSKCITLSLIQTKIFTVLILCIYFFHILI